MEYFDKDNALENPKEMTQDQIDAKIKRLEASIDSTLDWIAEYQKKIEIEGPNSQYEYFIEDGKKSIIYFQKQLEDLKNKSNDFTGERIQVQSDSKDEELYSDPRDIDLLNDDYSDYSDMGYWPGGNENPRRKR